MQVHRTITTLCAAVTLSLGLFLCAPTADAQTCPGQYTPGAYTWTSRNAATGGLVVNVDPYDLDNLDRSYVRAVNQYGTVLKTMQSSSQTFFNYEIPRGTGTVRIDIGNINRCGTLANWVYYATFTN